LAIAGRKVAGMASSSGDVYVDEPWLWIGWDRRHKCVHAEFKSFANSSEFRAGTSQILDLIRARKSTALVSDNRRLEGVTDLDQLWLRDSWLPQAVAAGVKRIAVVVASRGLGRVATEAVIGKFGKTAFETRMFDSLPDALTWVSEP
jgi:hypothetical protein